MLTKEVTNLLYPPSKPKETCRWSTLHIIFVLLWYEYSHPAS